MSPGVSAVLTAWRRQAGGIAKAKRAKRAKKRAKIVVCMLEMMVIRGISKLKSSEVLG